MAPQAPVRVLMKHNSASVKSGLQAYARALQKYNIRPTKPGPYYAAPSTALGHVLMKRALPSSGLQATQTGDVPAQDIEHDSEYICPVAIGSPAQTLNLDFDTGSADLWVFSTHLPSSVLSRYGQSHAVFDPSKSTSFKPAADYTWQIRYGDNSSASGVVGADSVTLGGITVAAQAIELADTLSPEFAQGAPDGLLGLAWSSINTVRPHPVQTVVSNMMLQQDIPAAAALFTCYLSSYTSGDDSFYTFGHLDGDVLAALQTAPEGVYYTPIDNTNGFWQFASSSACVNGAVVETAGNSAIADTGTTLALVSDQVCEAVYAAIEGAQYDEANQGWVYPSSAGEEQLPAVQVDVGGRLFTINKTDLGYVDLGNGFVYGGIQSRGSLPFDILGDTFLKSVYAVFDQGKKRFGAVQRSK